MILDFYLLEQSNYKQIKQNKTKIDEEVCPQIEKKVQEPSTQLSWNFPRVLYDAYKSSYVKNTSTSTSTKYQTEKEVPCFYELKIIVLIGIT